VLRKTIFLYSGLWDRGLMGLLILG